MELLCSAVRLVFGSVRENEKLSKEISLKNRWTEDTLKVNMLIEGDDAFYVGTPVLFYVGIYVLLFIQSHREQKLGWFVVLIAWFCRVCRLTWH